jgi:hypothetical protein
VNPDNKKKAVIGISLGVALIGAAVVLAVSRLLPMGALILFLSGYVIHLWGCAMLAKAKGYTAAQGVLAGLFTFLLLLIMPDRTKMSKAERDDYDREDAEDEARSNARRHPSKRANKASVWVIGLFFLTLGLVMVVGYEIHWARVVAPERKGIATAIAADFDKLDSQNDGKLIYITGALAGVETLTDPEFGVTVDALKLRRRVWMYQWQEESLAQSKSSYGSEDAQGNSTTYLKTQTYNYVKVWSEKVIDSHRFHARAVVPVPGTSIDVKVMDGGHDNPATMPIPARAVAAAKINLGAFTVGPELAEQIDNFQAVPVNDNNLAAIAEPLRAGVKLLGDAIYFGTNANQPAIGNLKVQFESAPAATASVIARQNGNDLSPNQVGNAGTVALLRIGTYSAPEMVAQFAKSHSQTKLIVWVAGCGFILFGGLGIRQARKQ